MPGPLVTAVNCCALSSRSSGPSLVCGLGVRMVYFAGIGHQIFTAAARQRTGNFTEGPDFGGVSRLE